MNFPQFRKAQAVWLLLWVVLLGKSRAQEMPSAEKIREIMAARESVLTDAISAKYSVSEVQLPGKKAWYRLLAEREPSPELSTAFWEDSPDNTIECAYDCRLELNGAMVKLAVIRSDLNTPHEEHYINDGNRSWNYAPAYKSASILAEPITPQTLARRNPWLPAYLATFPSHMSAAIGSGPTLSELLSPTSGNKVQMKEGEGGDWILEIRSKIIVRRSDFKDQDRVRRITLGRQVGFAPTHYVVYVQAGSEVFPPDFEARYENFMPSGKMQIPRRMVVVSGATERIRGKFGDPLKVVDFQQFKMEELTVSIDELTTAATFGPETFVFRTPPVTTVTDQYAERKRAIYLMWCRLLLVGGVAGWGSWYFRGLYLRRPSANERRFR